MANMYLSSKRLSQLALVGALVGGGAGVGILNARAGFIEHIAQTCAGVGTHSDEDIVDEAEAGVVRRVYEMYTVEGLSIGEITRRLNTEGVPARRASRWERSVVWGVLRNSAYRGVACFGCFSSYMAEVIEISMENDQPRIHRVVAAVDCGQVVNPGILEQQIQGGVVYGLGNALRARITIEKGRVVQANFDDYAPLRMEETPTVEVYAVPSTESPTGIGEPSVPPIAPALCNAIYAATGKRLRRLPLGSQLKS